MHKKVSILIPTYNREKIISETIDSALSQTYSNIEVIIVDNASTDDTWNVIQAYAKKDNRIKAFRNESNIGPVRNWLRCVDEASGEYGKILWSDDLIAPTFLEKTVPFLNDRNDVGFVFTGAQIFVDGTDNKTDAYLLGETGVYPSDDFIVGSIARGKYPVSPGCALFRMNDIEKNLLLNVPNKVDSDFSMHAIGNDLLLFLLTANTYKYFASVNEKLSFFRAHAGSISIQSNDGKIPLHYDLAISHFLEAYRLDLINTFNVKLFLDLKRYPSAKKYGLISIESFYMENKDFSFSFSTLLKRIYRSLLNRIYRYISRIKRK